MSVPARYTPYHPTWYRRRVPVWWWLRKWTYTKFILRELTSLFVGWAALLFLWQVQALRDGPEAHARFMAWLQSPFLVGLNTVALLFVLFHAITWFNLAPSAMVVRLRGTRVPDSLIIGSNYAAWVVLSGVVAWIVMRG